MRQREDIIQNLDGVGAIERAIAIGILRMIFGGASCTTLRVGFSQNDRSMFPLRKRCGDLESLLDGGKLAADPHLHVVGLPRGRSLGMKADEIEMRTNFAIRVIFLVR